MYSPLKHYRMHIILCYALDLNEANNKAERRGEEADVSIYLPQAQNLNSYSAPTYTFLTWRTKDSRRAFRSNWREILSRLSSAGAMDGEKKEAYLHKSHTSVSTLTTKTLGQLNSVTLMERYTTTPGFKQHQVYQGILVF